MYFSIPVTTDVSAKNSSNQQAYTSFNVYVNGVHHCSLRYSQLYTFNEELHRLLPSAMTNVETFPPKKFFSLSARETDERRVLLEHYLQSITQNKYIVSSSYFNEFFLNAQRETFTSKFQDNNEEQLNLKIFLLNNYEIILENILPKDNTTRVFDACLAKIQLQQDFLPYFALYFYLKRDDQLDIFRPLYDFESPYISLEQTRKVHENVCIVLKKSYWDLNFDLQLINDRRARNLLFVQAQYEIEQSQHLYPSDIYQQLEVLRENKSSKDYLLLARTSKYYGHIFLRRCSILYPLNDVTKQKDCQCLLAIGNSEIICCMTTDENKKMKEILFKVTRIRCWKVNRTKQETSILIEYLISKDTLEWITIHTEQASLVSNCLQSMVDEILAKKAGATTPVVLASVPPTPPTPSEQASSKMTNGLATRTLSDLEKFNNNNIFEKENDDDL